MDRSSVKFAATAFIRRRRLVDGLCVFPAPGHNSVKGGDGLEMTEEAALQGDLSFPKIQSGGIRVVRQNQRMIRCDVCDHPLACNYSRSVQVTAPA
jgi:hypothetical protein